MWQQKNIWISLGHLVSPLEAPSTTYHSVTQHQAR